MLAVLLPRTTVVEMATRVHEELEMGGKCQQCQCFPIGRKVKYGFPLVSYTKRTKAVCADIERMSGNVQRKAVIKPIYNKILVLNNGAQNSVLVNFGAELQTGA